MSHLSPSHVSTSHTPSDLSSTSHTNTGHTAADTPHQQHKGFQQLGFQQHTQPQQHKLPSVAAQPLFGGDNERKAIGAGPASPVHSTTPPRLSPGGLSKALELQPKPAVHMPVKEQESEHAGGSHTPVANGTVHVQANGVHTYADGKQQQQQHIATSKQQQVEITAPTADPEDEGLYTCQVCVCAFTLTVRAVLFTCC